MKFLVIVFFICLVGALAQELTDAQKQKLREHRDACVTETGADRADVDKAYKGEWADNPKLRCFTLCMMKKVGMMNDDGVLDETITRQRMALKLKPEKVDEIWTKCKDLKGTTACDTAYMMMKCYTENRAITV
ncbi:general odorant-binding protein 56d [Diachasma alloeum]|uniref:Odorant binding protein 6 n=1 Tax=Diachasma alloeum TaxID=454923 RepID=A0A4E0RTD9_9HYME|nr:general odorant-binding protein 56d [Diachasma alloeum]THK33257.1 odorant binding protein 6 [Diachasma alloeum]